MNIKIMSTVMLGMSLCVSAFAEKNDEKQLAMKIAHYLLDPACASSVSFLNGVNNEITDITVKSVDSDTTVYAINAVTHDEFNTQSFLTITVGMPQLGKNGESIPSVKCMAFRTQ